VLFGSRINCSQKEALGDLLSRLEEDKSEIQVGHVTFFLSATRLYFVIELDRTT